MSKVYVSCLGGLGSVEMASEMLKSILGDDVEVEGLNQCEENDDIKHCDDTEKCSVVVSPEAVEEMVKSGTIEQWFVDAIFDVADILTKNGLKRSPSEEELKKQWYDGICSKVGCEINKDWAFKLKEEYNMSDEDIVSLVKSI